MADVIKIVECPRDAWQGLPAQIPAEVKADYLRKLIEAGFTHIDAVSFVSPAAVPQMADSEQVLETARSARRSRDHRHRCERERRASEPSRPVRCRRLGFPYSISPEFLRRNQNQTPEESLEVLGVNRVLAPRRGHERGRLCFDGLWESLWRTVERRCGCGCMRSADRMRRAADLAGGYRGPGDARTNRGDGGARASRRIAGSRSACICMRGEPKQQRAFAPRMMRVAGGSMRPSAAWADARLRRMRWSATFPRKYWSDVLAQCGAAVARAWITAAN